MIHIKAPLTALVAACLLLTGCNGTDSQITPNGSELTDNGENPEQLGEIEQILKLMKNYGDLYYSMQPSKSADLEKIADMTNKLSVDGKDYPYMKLTSAPANTMKQLEEKLDGLVTDDLKKSFLDSITNDDYHYQIKDGDIYVTEECFSYGMGQGMDKLYLNSVEYPDEKTILVNMTSFGDKNKWETEKDIETEFTVSIVRTDDGFRIAECGIDAIPFLYYYHEVCYGEDTLSF